MSKDCSRFDLLTTLTLAETSAYKAVRDPGLTFKRTQEAEVPDLDLAQHRTLKRKHPKRHKREAHSRLTKTKLLGLNEDRELIQAEQKDVVLDGFGNDIRKRALSQSSGDYTQKDDPVKDFSWVFSDREDENPLPAPQLVSYTSCSDTSLSQSGKGYCKWSDGTSDRDEDYESERSAIEAQIKDKCRELFKIMDKINSKRLRRSRRLQRLQDEECDDVIPMYVNIHPIRRRRRTAQPIRNALLVRSSMKKAWKGALGSCCGKGCWATWQWMNMKRVMNDYE